MRIRPTGSRIRVRILSNERVTEGGVLVPGVEMIAAYDKKDEEDKGPMGKQYLQLVEVLEVGDGRMDPSTGAYRGSRYKKGQRCLMRCGISASVHIDFVPGKTGEAIVLEETIVGVIETGDEVKGATGTFEPTAQSV